MLFIYRYFVSKENEILHLIPDTYIYDLLFAGAF